ncbi:hypothetical protein POM88_015807 [Heracleum sosnowskyi]|uniref:Uncharacterized protein n=1 Tax=Heracleum sosnowskyi TaxID=360622 RepID=A0AAD8IMB7_9APIA|nr:hypothetical protein POM88_015807 [Heracleum sosnowskyi]
MSDNEKGEDTDDNNYRISPRDFFVPTQENCELSKSAGLYQFPRVPCVAASAYDVDPDPLLLVLICRNEAEKCLIETSINSLRISLKVKQVDELENILAKKILRFLSMRADAFQVLRRQPVQVRDLTIP